MKMLSVEEGLRQTSNYMLYQKYISLPQTILCSAKKLHVYALSKAKCSVKNYIVYALPKTICSAKNYMLCQKLYALPKSIFSVKNYNTVRTQYIGIHYTDKFK
jgi:hypothetical protein